MIFAPRNSAIEAHQFSRDGERLFGLVNFLARESVYEVEFREENIDRFSPAKGTELQIWFDCGNGTSLRLKEGDYLLKDHEGNLKVMDENGFNKIFEPVTKETGE